MPCSMRASSWRMASSCWHRSVRSPTRLLTATGSAGVMPDGMAPGGSAPGGMASSGIASSGGAAGGGGVGGGSTLATIATDGGGGELGTFGSGECPAATCSKGASGKVGGETDICAEHLPRLLDATDDVTMAVEPAAVVGVVLFNLGDSLFDSWDNSTALALLLLSTGLEDAAALSVRLPSMLSEGCLPFLRASF